MPRSTWLPLLGAERDIVCRNTAHTFANEPLPFSICCVRKKEACNIKGCPDGQVMSLDSIVGGVGIFVKKCVPAIGAYE